VCPTLNLLLARKRHVLHAPHLDVHLIPVGDLTDRDFIAWQPISEAFDIGPKKTRE
jgi:hypothetical protein